MADSHDPDRFDRRMEGTQINMASIHKLGAHCLDAVLVRNVEAAWYLIRSDREVTAAAGLAGRGFGIYLPMKRTAVMKRMQKTTETEPLFGGWVFIWLRDLEYHWPRIKTIPGVIDVLRQNEVPYVVAPEIVDEIQAREFREDGLYQAAIERIRAEGVPKTYRSGRGGKKHKGKRHRVAIEPRPIIRCYSALGTIDDLSPAQRNGLLFKALGLPEPAGNAVAMPK